MEKSCTTQPVIFLIHSGTEIRSGKLTDADEPVQLDLFSYDPKAIEKEQKMERAMDKIREKFGKDLIQKGIH